MDSGQLLQQFILAGIVVAVVLAISAVLGRTLEHLHQQSRIPNILVVPLKIAVKWGIMVLAFLVILQNFGLPLGGIWAALTTVLAMIAIGFVAVWSLLSNISATALILIFRPFEIGDQIEFVGEPTKGKVKTLGLIYSTLEEEGGALLQIPNNAFFQKVVRRHPGHRTQDLTENLRQSTRHDLDPEVS